jgi:hypothetical protein
VILDVATYGIISVAANQKLTLGYAGTSGAASGGIFTAAVTTSAGGAVKANAVTPNSSTGSIGTGTILAAAKVENKAAASIGNGDLGAGDTPGTSEPADGVITNSATVTIDKADTFAVDDDVVKVTKA